MEYLIRGGIPQRTAHELVGTLVRTALDRKVRLADLPLAEFREVHADLDENIYGVLGVENAVRAMQSYGSTAPQEVDRRIQAWKDRLKDICE